jgi:hypothetical protein
MPHQPSAGTPLHEMPMTEEARQQQAPLPINSQQQMVQQQQIVPPHTDQPSGPSGQPNDIRLIARDIPEAYFQTYDGVQSGTIPQGYHAVSDYGGVTGLHMANTSARQQPMRPNAQLGGQQGIDLAIRIAEVIQSQFGLKLKEQPFMYRHPYLEYFDNVPLAQMSAGYFDSRFNQQLSKKESRLRPIRGR